MRVLVCGGRDYDDRAKVYSVLNELDRTGDVSCIIHGAARGADSLAEDWALRRCTGLGNSIGVSRFPADWTRFGKSAGYIRNAQMLREGMPDLVVAFPGGRGTANMVKLAKDAGVEVIEVASSI